MIETKLKIIGASKEEKVLIKEILQDYTTDCFTVRVVGQKRNYGSFNRYNRQITVKRRPDIMDFYYVLAHEVCHYVQHITRRGFSEREADEFGIMKVNEKYGVNWKAEKKRNWNGRFNKYLTVNKGGD